VNRAARSTIRRVSRRYAALAAAELAGFSGSGTFTGTFTFTGPDRERSEMAAGVLGE